MDSVRAEAGQAVFLVRICRVLVCSQMLLFQRSLKRVWDSACQWSPLLILLTHRACGACMIMHPSTPTHPNPCFLLPLSFSKLLCRLMFKAQNAAEDSFPFILSCFFFGGRGGEREKSTRCSFHYWPATKPVDEGKRALCWAYRVTAVVSLCCLCCSAPRHAGDNRNHPTAGGEDLRPGRLLVSVRRLEHHRNPEEPKSVHQDCLWVHFKRHYGFFSAFFFFFLNNSLTCNSAISTLVTHTALPGWPGNGLPKNSQLTHSTLYVQNDAGTKVLGI